MEILKSVIDQSINFINWQPDNGAFEARYVRRSDDYFIVYLSSHTGCKMACRMCHLTQTGQTMMRNSTLADFIDQAKPVLDHYRTQPVADKVHFNFMARGEPLANPNILNSWNWVATGLQGSAELAGLKNYAFNISTIIPEQVCDVKLSKAFSEPHTALYYSLYSMRPEFRRKWLPRALEPTLALDKLVEWQQVHQRPVALHWTFIEGENDDMGTLEEIAEAVTSRDLIVKFNTVRYNPYSERQGKEPPEEIVQRNFDFLSEVFGGESNRIVPRIGIDCAASCGVFVTPE